MDFTKLFTNGQKPSQNQTDVFDWVVNGEGNLVLIAVAGSGKTTTGSKVIQLLSDDVQVAFLAFNKDIADALNDKPEIKNRKNVKASTFHKLCFATLWKAKEFRGVKKINVDAKKTRLICKEMMNATESQQMSNHYGMYADMVTDLVSIAKGLGLGVLSPLTKEAFFEIINHHDLYFVDKSANFNLAIDYAFMAMDVSEQWAKEKHLIDFDDQIYLPLLWKLQFRQFDWVLVDEAQDTNPVRRAVVKAILKPGGRMIAIGDPAQAIYGFTGASSDAIKLIKDEFNCLELPLSVCYRCGKNIVKAAQQFVPTIQPFEDADDGVVMTIETAKLEIPEKDLYGPHDIILCRNVAPLISKAFRLISMGVGCKIKGRKIGQGLGKMVKQMKARSIDVLIDRMNDYSNREISNAMAKGQEVRAEGIQDRVDAVMAVIENLPENSRTINQLLKTLDSMFSDSNGCLMLSTIHKAKGGEWDNVFILRPDLMPSKFARQAWQMNQEMNLIYVAYTRAIKRLTILVEPARERQEEF